MVKSKGKKGGQRKPTPKRQLARNLRNPAGAEFTTVIVDYFVRSKK
jgi:hypothetical protein